MLAFAWKKLFKMAGWTTGEGIPEDIKKCIVVAAPHTSNWDFFHARAAAYIFDIKVNYLIKNESFIIPRKEVRRIRRFSQLRLYHSFVCATNRRISGSITRMGSEGFCHYHEIIG